MKHPTKAERRKIGRLIRRGKRRKGFQFSFHVDIEAFAIAIEHMKAAIKKASESFAKFNKERMKADDIR